MAKRATPINTAINDMSLSIAELRKKQALLRKHRSLLNRFISRLGKHGDGEVLKWQPTISAERYEWSGYDELSVACTTNQLDGFKDARLVKLLGKFMDADETQTKDYAELINRTFRFKYRINAGTENEVRLSVSVDAYVKSDSPTCRKVLKKVTPRVVEDKEFEIVCS